MAEEVYMVAFNIQDAGSSFQTCAFTLKGAKAEATFPPAVQETGSLQTADGLTDRVATAKLVEVTASSAAEACEAVRIFFPECAGKMRAAVKPNTNFKSVTP